MTTGDETDQAKQGQQIKALFDQCLDHSKAEQQTIIQAAQVSDEVKSHVAQLLNFTTDELELTKAVVDSVQISLDVRPLSAGMKIGSYNLVRSLGAGGQGEVWLAAREGGDFQHQVAIKFLKPVHDQQELTRFQTERELLANLKHPNIAQLLDGGELADNRPYMVIELVEGLPVLEYGLHHDFDLKRYLRCFLQICDAISYAHSHSVIHRDIKPSNVYISHEGTVKLLDFGIAKFIDSDEVKTATMPMMTLAYSSPEQVTGQPVSTATDVYALGLLLYEMLTGHRAQAVQSDVPADLLHEITQQSPRPPSELIDSEKRLRQYSGKRLRGDLDNLVLMAVRKEPERRYTTVAAMAKDVENYLDGKPLLAVGDSWSYSFKKLILRNPMASLLSALVLVLMVVLPLVLFYNQQQLEVERDKALLAQQQAQEQTVIANRTTDFLVNILESASPLASQGEAINLDDVLLSAERQLSVGLDDQPRIKATLLSKLASIQHHLGDSKQAVEYYQKVLALHQSDQHLEGQVFALGQLAVMSYFANDEAAAIKYREQANQLSDLLEDPIEQAWHQARMATLGNYLGERPLVVTVLSATLEQLHSVNVTDATLLGRIYNELSIAESDKQLGLAHINQAIAYAEQLSGRMHPLYQSRQLNKALKLKQLQRHAEAEQVFLQLREDTRQLFTTQHPMYAKVLAELGALYHDKGRFSAVEEIYSEAIEISLQTMGLSNIEYVLQINNLAYLYEDMGRYAEAEPLYRESIKLRQQYHSSHEFRVASSEGNLARLLAKQGKHQESQQLLNRIIPIFTQHNKSNLQNNITAIANMIHRAQSPAACETAVKQIEQILPEVQKLSAKSWRRMHLELWLGELALACQARPLAEQLLRAAAAGARVIYDTDSVGQQLILARANVGLQQSKDTL